MNSYNPLIMVQQTETTFRTNRLAVYRYITITAANSSANDKLAVLKRSPFKIRYYNNGAYLTPVTGKLRHYRIIKGILHHL